MKNDTYYNKSLICGTSNTVKKLTSSVSSVIQYANLTTDQIQTNLMTYGPMAVGVYASSDSFMYAGSTGLIEGCTAGSTNHAILLVGYNSTHWFIKNSWGTNWGNNGYGYILKTNDCNLKTFVVTMGITYNYTPPPTNLNTVKLTVRMTDSYGDGWAGMVFGLKQNGVNVGSFGLGFTAGSAYGPITL